MVVSRGSCVLRDHQSVDDRCTLLVVCGRIQAEVQVATRRMSPSLPFAAESTRCVTRGAHYSRSVPHRHRLRLQLRRRERLATA